MFFSDKWAFIVWLRVYLAGGIFLILLSSILSNKVANKLHKSIGGLFWAVFFLTSLEAAAFGREIYVIYEYGIMSLLFSFILFFQDPKLMDAVRRVPFKSLSFWLMIIGYFLLWERIGWLE